MAASPCVMPDLSMASTTLADSMMAETSARIWEILSAVSGFRASSVQKCGMSLKYFTFFFARIRRSVLDNPI